MDMMEKRCKYPGCDCVIARKKRGVTDKHYNAVQYCPEHRKLVRDAYKEEYRREERRTCRITNKRLREECRLSRMYIDELKAKLGEREGCESEFATQGGLQSTVDGLPCYDEVGQSLALLDRIQPRDFELWCAGFLVGCGFENVSVTQYSGDYGADILAEKDKAKYAVQVKHHSKRIGQAPIREVLGGLVYYDRDVGMVITNNYFSRSAISLAEKAGVILWDRDVLLKHAPLIGMCGET